MNSASLPTQSGGWSQLLSDKTLGQASREGQCPSRPLPASRIQHLCFPQAQGQPISLNFHPGHRFSFLEGLPVRRASRRGLVCLWRNGCLMTGSCLSGGEGEPGDEDPQILMAFNWQEVILPAWVFTAFNPKPTLLLKQFPGSEAGESTSVCLRPSLMEMKE